MKTYKLMTKIGPTGCTDTPVEILAMAARLSASISEYLGHGGIVARIVPDVVMDGLYVELTSKSRSLTLMVFVGNVYKMDGFTPSAPTKAHKLVIDKTWVNLPDLPEALHFLGIVFDDLGVRVTSIGRRDREWNMEVLSYPATDKGTPGLLDSRLRDRSRRGRQYSGNDRFFASKDGTHTPLEVFDWICEISSELGFTGKVRVTLSGIRLWGAEGVSGRPLHSDADTNDAALEKIHLLMTGQDGRQLWLCFRTGTKLTFNCDEVRVVHFMHALHIIGALVDTLPDVEIKLGHRTREQNAAVLARPLDLETLHGEMVSASNLVLPSVAEAA